MASGGFRSLLAFWLGGGASGGTAPPVVVTQRPVGIPQEPQRQHFRPIRGKGRVQLRGLSVVGRGATIIGVAGRGVAALSALRAAGKGRTFAPIGGSGHATLAPMAAAGRGRVPMLFYEDEVAAILAAMR